MAIIGLLPKFLGEVVVTTAGTAVPLSATELRVMSVTIQWDSGNVGPVYVGRSDVSGVLSLHIDSTQPSITISAEDSVADEDMISLDLAQIYIDAANNGDKVRVAYLEYERKEYN